MVLPCWIWCATAVSDAASGQFLRREGAQLLIGDRPFRSVGVNKHELFDHYVQDLMGAELDQETAFAMARRSLDGLADLGVDIVRTRAIQYWPASVDMTYFGGDEAREIYWQRFDMMLEDLRVRRIRAIPTLSWSMPWPDLGHESLKSFASNPYSPGRLMWRGFVEDIVSRYKDSETILFWELTNEANLGVDLSAQIPDGILQPKPAPEHLARGPVVRDDRNHWTADELAAFTRETAWLIKSLDPNHPIGTGFSGPRHASWHLWMGSLRRAEVADWTRDTDEQQAYYIRLLTPEPVDLISFHAYLEREPNFDPLVLIKTAADDLGRPVYCGELGVADGIFPGPKFDSPIACRGLEYYLEVMDVLDVPLSLVWTWDEAFRPYAPLMGPSGPDEAVEALRSAHARASSRTEPQVIGVSEDARLRLDEINSQWRDLVPAE